MRKQCVIVGLGKYGTSIAKKLSDSKIEVLAIDNASYHYRSFKTFLFLNVCYGHCSI